jgi:acetylornithine/succinyldiaminopimelate/putrescine aminotransferase
MISSNCKEVYAIKMATVAKSGEYVYIANPMLHGRTVTTLTVTTLTIFLEKSVPYLNNFNTMNYLRKSVPYE